MYGLTGSCVEKKSQGCYRLRQSLTSNMNMGCPFVHLNEKQLADSLPAVFSQVKDMEDIMRFKSSGQAGRACAAYLSCQKALCSRKNLAIAGGREIKSIEKPIDYYYLAKSIGEKLG